MKYLVWMALAFTMSGLLGFARGPKDDQSPEGKAYRAAYGLVLEGKWNQADEALSSFIKTYPRSRWTDDTHFWRCYISARKSGNKEVAFTCFESFASNFPRSSYIKDAQAEMVTLARDLVKQGKPEYEDKVRDLKRSQEVETTLMVLSALRDIGDDQAWDALLDYYAKSDNERIRKAIVRMLDDFKRDDASKMLMDIFKKDASQQVRLQALRTLGEFENDPAVSTFMRNIVTNERESMTIRKQALSRLGDFKSQDHAALFEEIALQGPPELSRTAVNQIANMKDGSGFDTLVSVYEKSSQINVKRKILSVLADRYSLRSIDVLEKAAITSQHRDVRRTAIYALAEVEHPSVLKRLEHIIDTVNDSDTRRYAIRGIGELKGAPAVQSLVKILEKHNDPRTRREAARSLANIAKADAVEHLKKAAINDSNFDVRKSAIDALGDIKHISARKALIEILEQNQKNKL